MELLTARFSERHIKNYRDRSIEAIKDGDRVKFFEVRDGSQSKYRISKELMKWLIDNKRILKQDNPDFFMQIKL